MNLKIWGKKFDEVKRKNKGQSKLELARRTHPLFYSEHRVVEVDLCSKYLCRELHRYSWETAAELLYTVECIIDCGPLPVNNDVQHNTGLNKQRKTHTGCKQSPENMKNNFLHEQWWWYTAEDKIVIINNTRCFIYGKATAAEKLFIILTGVKESNSFLSFPWTETAKC